MRASNGLSNFLVLLGGFLIGYGIGAGPREKATVLIPELAPALAPVATPASNDPEAWGYRLATDGTTYRVENNWCLGVWGSTFPDKRFTDKQKALQWLEECRREAPKWQARYEANEKFIPVEVAR